MNIILHITFVFLVFRHDSFDIHRMWTDGYMKMGEVILTDIFI